MRARLASSLIVFCLSIVAVTAASAQATQQPAKPFEPQVGQAGKDVVWVPTPQPLVEKMLDMAKVTPQDFVMDLGSGDGRTVITAAKRGATAMGIEYNPDMVDLSKKNATAAGVTAKATFMKADLFETDLSKAQVITMFLLPSINMKLRPKILDLRPGTRIVNNTFQVTGWDADASETVEGSCTSWCTSHLNIVPAKVAGTWRLGTNDLALTQQFQVVTGTLGATPIAGGRLSGDQISFTVGSTQYTGKVSADRMEGTATTTGKTQQWMAAKSN